MKKAINYLIDNKYKMLGMAFTIIIMMFLMIKTIQRPILDLVDREIAGHSMTFMLPFTVVMFMLLIIGFVFLLFKIDRSNIEKSFLYCGIIFGILYLIILPPLSAPDEITHFKTVYYYSSKILGQDAVDEKGNVLFQADYILYTHEENYKPTKESYSRMYNYLFEKRIGDDTVAVGPRLPIPATSYLPQIIGVSLARLFGANIVTVLFMGRVFAFIFYLVSAYIAVKIVPVGKEIFMVVALLPMPLHIGISYSYDAILLSLCFVLSSLIIFIALKAEQFTWKYLLLLMILFSWIALPKIIYIALAFMMLIIPNKKFGKWLYKYLSLACVIVPGIIIILVNRLQNIVSSAGASAIGDNADPTYTIYSLIHEPFRVIRIIYATIVDKGAFYIDTMLGQDMGWMELYVPAYIIYGFMILLVWSTIKRTNNALVLRSGQKLWIVIVTVGICSLVCLAFLLDMTPYGHHIVMGVQGRYFLPMLPLLMLTIKNEEIVMSDKAASYIPVAIYLLQFLMTYHLFIIIAGR